MLFHPRRKNQLEWIVGETLYKKLKDWFEEAPEEVFDAPQITIRGLKYMIDPIRDRREEIAFLSDLLETDWLPKKAIELDQHRDYIRNQVYAVKMNYPYYAGDFFEEFDHIMSEYVIRRGT